MGNVDMKVIDKSMISSRYADDIQQEIAEAFTQEDKTVDLEKTKVLMTQPLYNYFMANGFSMWLEHYNAEIYEPEEDYRVYTAIIKSELLDKDYKLSDYYVRHG